MRVVRINSGKCKSCWNWEPEFRCIVPYEPRYEAFRSQQKFRSGPGRKMSIPPCVAACPANICVQGYVGLVAAGLYEEAYRLIRWRVPFPHVLSLVCPHPCEEACIRGDYDQPIAINALKRVAIERVTPEMRQSFLDELKSDITENDLKIAVVGSGPAGLTAAHDLRLRGYSVTIFETFKKPGGMMLAGIPEYRLPQPVLEQEIEQILQLGIELHAGVRVGQDFAIEELLNKYEAVFLATGAPQGTELKIAGEGAGGVLQALDLLRELNLGRRPQVGPRVAVIGGGDAAVDGARVALRLGAEDVKILYRRSLMELPAHPEQVNQAKAEGIKLEEQVAPVRFLTENGQLRGVELARTEPGAVDETGRRRPVPIPGSNFTTPVDTAIIAIGQRADPQFLKGLGVAADRRGLVQVEPDMMTSVEGLFAGGDLVTGPATVIEAIAAGKRAAWTVDRYLRGEGAKPVCFRSPADLEGERRYHPPYIFKQPRPKIPQAPVAQRVKDFGPVQLRLGEAQARAEAWRCLACGRCANCNACLDVFACPAIFIGAEGQPQINQMLCRGCGFCLQICPNDAIEWAWRPSPAPLQQAYGRGRGGRGRREKWRVIG